MREFWKDMDDRILAELYASRAGADFIEELVTKFGSRFGGSDQEREAGHFLAERLLELGVDKAWTEPFQCHGWIRKETTLYMTSPIEKQLDCIALPNCPAGEVEAPLVYLGDGDPQTYADYREQLKGAIAMVSTANPAFYHRGMHRGEKLGRAVEAGVIGFIWMRGEGGGLPETGSARFGQNCEVPVISVSLETGMEILRAGKKGPIRLKIWSNNQSGPTTSYNAVGEIRGKTKPDEIIVIGGHYDGHDISPAAVDNGTGIAVILETARALATQKGRLDRTIRFIGFAQEEMGLLGSEAYVRAHKDENIVFMLNLDCAGNGYFGRMTLQGWSEDLAWLKQLFGQMHEGHVRVGDAIGTYSDMYHFSAVGFPSGSYASSNPTNNGGAPRGFGHTYWDTLDKLNPRTIQLDAILVSKLIGRLATEEKLPFRKKTPAEITEKLRQRGMAEVMAYELRKLPDEMKY